MTHMTHLRRWAPLLAMAGIGLLAGCNGNDDGITDTTGAAFQRIFGTDAAGLVNGDAMAARFSNPANVDVAADGTVYVADYDNDAVRRISTAGIVSTLVLQDDFSRPFGLATAADGTLYVQTDGNDLGARDATTGTVWRVDPATAAATVVARNLGRPRGLLVLADGRIAMSDPAHHVLALLNPADGSVTALAGGMDQAGYVDGSGTAARFSRPYGLALAADGALLVADQDNNRIRRVTLAGVVSTFAGSGAAGAVNGPSASASFDHPQDLAVAGGAVYVADHDNHLIRAIAADGTVSSFAGNGMQGFLDGEGSAAEFFGLEGIAATADGKVLWIADGNNGDGDPYNRVRRLRLP